MSVIELQTFIAAPRERVFDLARSIDAHQHSATGTAERAVAGVASGLIALGDEVTWEAKHFGLKQRLTVRITAFERPARFQDVMISGAFKSMQHDHEFIAQEPGTLMLDRFAFESPFGILGRIFTHLILTPTCAVSSCAETASSRPWPSPMIGKTSCLSKPSQSGQLRSVVEQRRRGMAF